MMVRRDSARKCVLRLAMSAMAAALVPVAFIQLPEAQELNARYHIDPGTAAMVNRAIAEAYRLKIGPTAFVAPGVLFSGVVAPCWGGTAIISATPIWGDPHWWDFPADFGGIPIVASTPCR